MSTETQNNVDLDVIITYDGQMITSEQIKFGLIAANLTAKDVSEATEISANAIGNLVKKKRAHKPNKNTTRAVLDVITDAMQKKGWEFRDGGIVRISPTSSKHESGGMAEL